MSARLESQRGNALLFVTVIGLVITIAFALFMSSTVVVEERAVEAELAKSRVYWAQMGNFNYALSRISYSQLCNPCGSGNRDLNLGKVLNAYLAELSNNWTYLDESTNYNFSVSPTGSKDDRVTGNSTAGYLMATADYTASTLLTKSGGKLPRMELRLCVGLSAAGANCGNIGTGNGGNTTAFFSINRLTNLRSP
jgi:hypothetical protein